MVLSLTKPLQVGIYLDLKLHQTYTTEEQTSSALPEIFEEILKNFKIDTLYYAKGPGSFMAIKVSYLFLKSLSITLERPLLAADGFHFNANKPIKAHGNRFFMKKNGKISIKQAESNTMPAPFTLPTVLNRQLFEVENEPLYVLPAL